jgi:hypothetical protein
MAKRKFIEGQKIGDKVVKEVFRNVSSSHYLITFTDGTSQIFNF